MSLVSQFLRDGKKLNRRILLRRMEGKSVTGLEGGRLGQDIVRVHHKVEETVLPLKHRCVWLYG